MPVTINGDGSITGLSQGGISNTKAIAASAVPAGSVIQTVSQTFDPYGDSGSDRGSSTSYSDTGIVLSMTPTVSTSKILVMSEGGSFGYKTSDSQVDYYIRLVGTPTGGSLTQFREIEVRHTVANNTTQRLFDSWSMSYLHDHNGTVAIEYNFQDCRDTYIYCLSRFSVASVSFIEIAH